ncbi:DUF1302 family protein [Pseudomonas sp. NPDC007930]|uniref:DUF1302 domain-containing protein n=1 Tax=Pseudomonas sp. NPDC007930 TaxID=3364417 RepID=UPI0036ECECD2
MGLFSAGAGTLGGRAWQGSWALGVVALMAGPSFGVPLNIGPVEGQFDTQFSLSSGWGLASPSQRLVGASNGGHAAAASSDDGRLNFKRGEAFSRRFEGVHALELRYQDSGLYLRGRYWYDFKLEDEHQRFKDIDDSGRALGSRSAGGQLLEAFAWQHYQLGGQPGTVRVGRQVVHWGEAQLIGGGIDAINPTGAQLFPSAAAPWREQALPTSLFYVRQNLTDALSVDGFYQLAWDPDQQANCGTFFASSDALAKGCAGNLALGPASAGQPEGTLVARGHDDEPSSGGQFGLAVHYQLSPWNTELGAYVLNYHSRAAYLAGDGPGYYVKYPENIHLYGLSFSSVLPEGTRWRGELSYRPNAPLQENWYSVLQQSNASGADQGYQRAPVTDLRSSLEHTFDGGLGADRFTLLAELGATRVNGLGSGYYGRDVAFGAPPGQCQAGSRYCDGGGFTTTTAWGYRARAQWTFFEVVPRLTLRPSLAWAHDVNGYSPQPGGQFEEGRKAVTLGLDADYQRTYSASLAYTNYFGGRYSTINDRDFLALTLGLRF